MKLLHKLGIHSRHIHTVCNALAISHGPLCCRGEVLIILWPTVSQSRLKTLLRRADILSRGGYQCQVIPMLSSCSEAETPTTAGQNVAKPEPSMRQKLVISNAASRHNTSCSVFLRLLKGCWLRLVSTWRKRSNVQSSGTAAERDVERKNDNEKS